MSTQAMCPDQDALVSYLYDEYEGSELFDRQAFERHLDACEQCAAEVAALGGVRRQLREWSAPEKTPLGFRVVREPASRSRWWTGHSIPFPLAAAAALVLGAALGMARLDVQYDEHGFRVRTGWGHQDAAAAVAGGQANTNGVTQTASSAPANIESNGSRAVAAAVLGATSAGPQAGVPSLVAPMPASAAPWRSDLQALERQMRQEFAAMRQNDLQRAGSQVAAASVINGDGPRLSDAALVQRIQQMIDQSEVRQQQNLALRVAELSRDFDVQRRSDLVRIEQSFGRINDQREQDAQQQRLLLNAIRVSQQKP